MKLWSKDKKTNRLVEAFTVGRDREFDLRLAPYDVLGSIAHGKMLRVVGLLAPEEENRLVVALREIYQDIEQGDFEIDEGVEDVHSQVELLLTEKLGDVGKKIHSGRSRNDQVLLDMKLFLRDALEQIAKGSHDLFEVLLQQSEKHKDVLIPGYTHLQIAMPSSFGLWFGAYAESLSEDMILLKAAYEITNQNPLGSAAGYGSSFPLDRQMTTRLLAFEDMNYNVVYAQMGRGKTEKTVAFAMAGIASTLAKMAMDVCLFTSQNFGFITLPDEFTTGSSIMPHKKNPDVFELIRGKCNRIQALPQDITAILINLPSGYHRDLQVLKELLIPAIDELIFCLQMALLMLKHAVVKENVLDDPRYDYIFSVEEVNRLVLEGKSFRDAYHIVGERIANGDFVPNKQLQHTHQGSIGNLCNKQIREKMKRTFEALQFDKVSEAYGQLLNDEK